MKNLKEDRVAEDCGYILKNNCLDSQIAFWGDLINLTEDQVMKIQDWVKK
jgi:hypothetical protein